IHADSRDVDHACALGRSGLRDRSGSDRLDSLETLPAPLEQDSHKIDHEAGPAGGRGDRGRVAQISLHGVDLPDPAKRLKESSQIRTPHGHPNPKMLLRQCSYDMTA